MRRVMIATGVIAMTLATSPAVAEGPVAVASAAPSASAAPAATSATPAPSAPAPVVAHTAPTPARPPVASAASPPPPVVTPPAVVAAPPAPPPAPAAAPSASAAPIPSLPTRETKLQLASETPSSSWGYKLAFVAVIIAGGVVAWKKRKGSLGLSLAAKDDGLRVRARAPLGMRAEVAVIEVGGMRVLVGVTASSVQTLAMLDPEEETATEPSERPVIEMLAPPAPRGRASIDDRARTLFGEPEVNPRAAGRQAAARYADVEAIPKRTARRPKAANATKVADAAREDGPLEGQARGITLALGPKP